MPLTVELVSPEKVIFSGEAETVMARTSDGEIAFQAGHVPFVGVLVPGKLKISLTDNTTQELAAHSGFIEVSHGKVTVLTDVVEFADEIDVPRAQAAKERAAQAMSADASDDDARAAYRRADARLNTAGV